MKSKAVNEYETFLNECNTYVWEWYIPEQFVRFGIPSLNGLWIDDKEKIFKLTTVLERVHPDDFDKIFVRRTSPLYKSDEMFEVDIRLNLTGRWEWFGFRGKTLRRDKSGRPIHLRGVAINIDQRIRAQVKLLASKDHLLQNERQKTDYCAGVMQEVMTFFESLASNAEAIISGDVQLSAVERAARVADMRQHVTRIFELNDKMRGVLGNGDEELDRNVRSIALWEHLAELQQVYALKPSSVLKLYFSNQYDDLKIRVNVKLFDLLVENVINSLSHSLREGYLTMNYSVSADDRLSLAFTMVAADGGPQVVDANADTTSSLGLSVCRLIAKRMWGDVDVVKENDGRMHYTITLPLDASLELGSQSEGDGSEAYADDNTTATGSSDERVAVRSGQPHVLIGTIGDASAFQHQNMFDVIVANDTDAVLRDFETTTPEIVFVDYNLRGSIAPLDLVARLHTIAPDTPIVVTSDYAHRILHRKVRDLGARYLLTNPLSLRKVNVMIRKYLA